MNLKYPVARFGVLSLVLFALIATLPNLAISQENSQQDTVMTKNYQLERHKNGFVRLERSSGKTSFCRLVGEDFVCNLAIEESDALHAEISELQNRIAALQGKLDQISSDSSQLRRPLKKVPNPDVGEQSGAGRDEIEKEFDRAIDLTKHTMRKLFQAVKELQKEMAKE